MFYWKYQQRYLHIISTSNHNTQNKLSKFYIISDRDELALSTSTQTFFCVYLRACGTQAPDTRTSVPVLINQRDCLSRHSNGLVRHCISLLRRFFALLLSYNPIMTLHLH